MKKLYPKEKVIVSACLLGQYCRYDGETKQDNELLEWLEDKEVIPFCPEAPALGTPRPRINVVQLSNRYALFRENDGFEVTQAILDETQKCIQAHPDADYVILKSKSPSCGCGTTPIFDTAGHELKKGDGLAVMAMKKVFVKIYDETNYKEKRC